MIASGKRLNEFYGFNKNIFILEKSLWIVALFVNIILNPIKYNFFYYNAPIFLHNKTLVLPSLITPHSTRLSPGISGKLWIILPNKTLAYELDAVPILNSNSTNND